MSITHPALATYSIKFAGKAIADTVLVQAIEVESSLSEPARLTLTILPSHGEVEAAAIEEALSHWSVGESVEVSLGRETVNTSVFSGEIRRAVLHVDHELGGEILIEALSNNSPTLASAVEVQANYGVDVLSAELELPWHSGEVEIPGEAAAVPGATLTRKGFGKPFDTSVLIQSVTHHLVDGHWTTAIEF